MTNQLFDFGRNEFLVGDIDWNADTIKVVLVDEGIDVPAPNTDQFLSDITSGARVATSTALTGKTASAGTADANDVTLSNVSGNTVESIVVYREDPGGAASSQLIAYIDTASGLPVTPNGGDITISWDASGVFTL